MLWHRPSPSSTCARSGGSGGTTSRRSRRIRSSISGSSNGASTRSVWACRTSGTPTSSIPSAARSPSRTTCWGRPSSSPSSSWRSRTPSPATTCSSSPRSSPRALATAWVARRSGGSAGWRALLAGWVFAFSPFRFQHLNHFQILLAQWIPLTLWWWDRLLAERTPGHAVRFSVFYLLHVTGGCYLAYMIHIPLLVLLANRAAVHGRELVTPRSLRVLLPVAAGAGLLLAVLFLPYRETSRRLGLTRDETEIGALGAALPSYLSPVPRKLLFRSPPKRSFWRRPGRARSRSRSSAPRTPCSRVSCRRCWRSVWMGGCWRRPHPPGPLDPQPAPSLPPGEGGTRRRIVLGCSAGLRLAPLGSGAIC